MTDHGRRVAAVIFGLLVVAVLMVLCGAVPAQGQDYAQPFGSIPSRYTGAYCDGHAAGHQFREPWPASGWESKNLDCRCSGRKAFVTCCYLVGDQENPVGHLNLVFQQDSGQSCTCTVNGPVFGDLTTTPTPTATQSRGGPSSPGPSPSDHTPTPTPTATVTGPESPSVPTAAPLGTSTPTKGGNTPTPQPTPTHRPWRSPCLIQHPGAPLNLCESGNGWRLYYFGHGGQVRTGPFVPRWGGTEDSIFFATVSPTTGKPVLAQWIADRRVVRIITYYDHYPHARHKTYAFDIMPDGTVVHRVW